MINRYETRYLTLVRDVLANGARREGRNGFTLSTFPGTLSFDAGAEFPLLTTRKMFYKGVLGELAAFVRGPKSVADFEAWGCNYWGQWANEDGSIDVDYGNKWISWRGHNQLKALVNGLRTDPMSRRHMLTSWAPENVLGGTLSLPCCHHTYQFYVRDGYLDMHWMQRSTDVMIGLPSDAILAAAMVKSLAYETDLSAGRVTMSLGDTHIYEEHIEGACELVKRRPNLRIPSSVCVTTLTDFDPRNFCVYDYGFQPAIKFEVKT